MTLDSEIDKLKRDIFSDNWDLMHTATRRLFDIGGKDNLDYLIALLDQSNSEIRNSAALTFRDNEFNDALEPLLKSIKKEENKGRIGTLVYALEKLDCSKKLTELFDILFNNSNFEVQHHILIILEEQAFNCTNQDLLEIKIKWEKIKNHWNEISHIDKSNVIGNAIDEKLMQYFVDEL